MWPDDAPEGWDPNVYRNQSGRGRGASARYGPRPPSPDTVAERGTKAWRDAFNAQRQWMQQQIFAGATLADMGFDPIRGRGLHAYTALSEGDFAPWRGDWQRAARGSPRVYYDSLTGEMTPVGGAAATTAPTGAPAPPTPFPAPPPPAPPPGPSPTFGTQSFGADGAGSAPTAYGRLRRRPTLRDLVTMGGVKPRPVIPPRAFFG